MINHPARALGRPLARAVTWALVTSYAAVALYGSLFTSLTAMVLAVPVLAAIGAVVARSVDDSTADLTRLVPAAIAAALFVPFVTGVLLLGDVGGYLMLAVLGLVTLHAGVWAHTEEPSAAASRRVAGPSPSSTDPAGSRRRRPATRGR